MAASTSYELGETVTLEGSLRLVEEGQRGTFVVLLSCDPPAPR